MVNNQPFTVKFVNHSSHLFSVSAWPYHQKELERADHDYELTKSENIIVNIDHHQMGVGGDNSWGLPVNDQYLNKAW